MTAIKLRQPSRSSFAFRSGPIVSADASGRQQPIPIETESVRFLLDDQMNWSKTSSDPNASPFRCHSQLRCPVSHRTERFSSSLARSIDGFANSPTQNAEYEYPDAMKRAHAPLVATTDHHEILVDRMSDNGRCIPAAPTKLMQSKPKTRAATTLRLRNHPERVTDLVFRFSSIRKNLSQGTELAEPIQTGLDRRTIGTTSFGHSTRAEPPNPTPMIGEQRSSDRRSTRRFIIRPVDRNRSHNAAEGCGNRIRFPRTRTAHRSHPTRATPPTTALRSTAGQKPFAGLLPRAAPTTQLLLIAFADSRPLTAGRRAIGLAFPDHGDRIEVIAATELATRKNTDQVRIVFSRASYCATNSSARSNVSPLCSRISLKGIETLDFRSCDPRRLVHAPKPGSKRRSSSSRQSLLQWKNGLVEIGWRGNVPAGRASLRR